MNYKLIIIIPVQDDALSNLKVIHDELLKDPSVHFVHGLAFLVAQKFRLKWTKKYLKELIIKRYL